MANEQNGLGALAGVFLSEIEGSAETNVNESEADIQSSAPEQPVEPVEEVDEIDELAGISEDDDEPEAEDVSAEPEAPRKYKVKVDGDEVEVDEAELKSGYSRTQDYTRKTTRLAEERKAFEAEQSELKRERELYSQILENWEKGLESVLSEFVPGDLNELRQYDPEKYIEVNEKLQKHHQTLENIKAEKARVGSEAEKAQKEQFSEYVKAESDKLYNALPEWKDETVRRKEVQLVTDYAKERFGFSDGDINNTYSHALWVAMLESMKYRKIVEKRKQLKPEVKVKSSEPGATSIPTTKAKKIEKVSQQLKKTGSAKDYAALLLETMQD